jgi:hypothetical protein
MRRWTGISGYVQITGGAHAGIVARTGARIFSVLLRIRIQAYR